MTDDPTSKPSGEPSQPDNQPPPQPSDVGFAAINLPGEQAPSQPPTYNSYNPPPPPTPPVYQFDYSRSPKTGGNGPAIVLVALLGFILVLVVGFGGMVALGIGPFARTTPVPTLIAQPTPTARPITPAPTSAASSTPAPSPTGSAGPTATPVASGDVTGALLSHIPLPIEPTCSVTTGSGKILAIARCSVDDGNIQLTYFQYDSYDSMFTTYDGFRMASEIEPGTGDCSNHDSWPAEDGFNISGQLAGRWLCTEALGATSIYWTDNRLNILSQATQTVPDYERFVNFWLHESGPNLQPFSN